MKLFTIARYLRWFIAFEYCGETQWNKYTSNVCGSRVLLGFLSDFSQQLSAQTSHIYWPNIISQESICILVQNKNPKKKRDLRHIEIPSGSMVFRLIPNVFPFFKVLGTSWNILELGAWNCVKTCSFDHSTFCTSRTVSKRPVADGQSSHGVRHMRFVLLSLGWLKGNKLNKYSCWDWPG